MPKGRPRVNSNRRTFSSHPTKKKRSDKKNFYDPSIGGDQVEGIHAVKHLLLAKKRRVLELRLIEGSDESKPLSEIISLAKEAGVPIKNLSRASLLASAGSEAPQGVIAKAEELPLQDLEELLSNTPAPSLLVALDGITDPYNLGAILRSAVSSGIKGVILPKHRSANIAPSCTKAAAGAIEYLDFCLTSGIPTALATLSKLNVTIIGLDGESDKSLFDLELHNSQDITLVLGSEGKGLGELTKKRCDQIFSIPMGSPIESLNVSAAAALSFYEIFRKKKDS